MSVLAGEKLEKVYTGSAAVSALSSVSVALAAGERLGIAGPSGSGKTTLLAILGGLDPPSSGRVLLDGQDLYALSGAARTRFRSARIGFVFQTHNLLGALTAEENVALAVRTIRGRAADPLRAAREALATLGLADLGARLPSQLSLGQQQRVAVARALAIQPAVLIADEPTASLDGAAGEKVLDALEALSRRGCAVVLASHDERCLARMTRRLELRDGRVAS